MTRNVLSGNVGPETVALFSRKLPGKFKIGHKSTGNYKREKWYCSHCKIPGHVLENCFKAGNAKPPTCSHCDMIGHTKDQCYKLHRYPPGHKLRGKGKSIGSSLGSFANQISGYTLNESEDRSYFFNIKAVSRNHGIAQD